MALLLSPEARQRPPTHNESDRLIGIGRILRREPLQLIERANDRLEDALHSLIRLHKGGAVPVKVPAGDTLGLEFDEEEEAREGGFKGLDGVVLCAETLQGYPHLYW